MSRQSHWGMVGGLTALLMLIEMGAVWGQGFRPPQRELPQLAVEGALEAMGSGRIQLKTATDQVWILQVMPNAKVEVAGKAKADFLGAGQYIEFTATVDTRNARVDETITKLTIFTPDQKRMLGAFFDQGFGKKEKGKEPRFGDAVGPGAKPGPGGFPGAPGGLGPAPGGPGLDQGGVAPSKGRKTRSGGKAAPVAARQAFEIRGQIRGVKNGKFLVHVPNMYFKPELTIEVADDAEIGVELTGPAALSVLRRGDRVQARGRQFTETAGQAAELQVTLADPLSAEQMRGPGKKHPSVKGERPSLKAKRAVAEEPAAEDEQPKETKKGTKRAPRPPAKEPADDAGKDAEEK